MLNFLMTGNKATGIAQYLVLLAEICLLALVMFSVHTHLDLPGERLADYGQPDSIFYINGAKNLAAGNGYTIDINGQDLPPKFPPGISFLLTPWFLLQGKEVPHPLPVTHALSYLLCLGLWLFVRLRSGPLTAFIALLGYMAGNSFIYHRLHICTPIPDSLILLGLITLLAKPQPGRTRIISTGLLLGAGVWFHYSNLILLGPTLLLLHPLKTGFRHRITLLTLGILPLTITLLGWQWAHFGNPLASGYHLWLPQYHADGRSIFGLDYALYGPAEGKMEGSNLLFYSSFFCGREKMLYLWPVAIALPLSLLFAVRRHWGGLKADQVRTVFFSTTTMVSFYFLFSVYFYQGERLICHLAPLASVTAALGIQALGNWLRSHLSRHLALLALVPLILFAGANLFQLVRNFNAVTNTSMTMNGQTKFLQKMARSLPGDATVISDMDLLFMATELPGRRVLPLKKNQTWVYPLACRDWQQAHPKTTPPPLATMLNQNAIGELALLAPPAETSINNLKKDLAEGKKIFLVSFNNLKRHPLLKSFQRQPLHQKTPPFTWQLTLRD